ncbi:hypothetical protein SAMN05444156_1260 [Verrucomicrobium sp. GAS474]|uniref:hypothetical protein n=1 Tax=Verrucomicrobium sp. GAS474 TaxID=1882831 RepID=UPI00087A18FB|nr:hypothetical protein [Verrucomicrobium sp. GAS474]SDT98548.1 hypothetical protein SAMN05444156_1260 [Verrucomicrobium sp. GAS474]
MRLILAHVRKDIAALRPLLIGWVVAAVVTAFNLTTGSVNIGAGSHSLSGGFGIFLLVLLFAILAARVIHEDALAETADVFWRTRPISRLQLLAAKGLFIGVLAAGTAGILLLTPSPASIPYRQGLTVLLGLVAFAVVTPNLTRLLALAIGMAVGVGFLIATVRIFLVTHGTGSFFFQGQPGFLAAHLDGIGQGIYWVGYLGVIFHHYLTLRWKTSFALLAITSFLPSLLPALFFAGRFGHSS